MQCTHKKIILTTKGVVCVDCKAYAEIEQ